MSVEPHVEVSRRNSSNDALERAALALQMQRPDEAERLAAGILKANRGNTVAAAILGRALMAQNRADEAISPLERVVRRGGESGNRNPACRSLFAAGLVKEALDQLRQTI